MNQVLDEIGINLDEQMVAAPGQKAQVLKCGPCSYAIYPAILPWGCCTAPNIP